MTTKKIIATTAMAALAVPAAAVADKSDEHGSKGKSDAAEQHAKTKKAKKQHARGFALKGISATGLTVTDGKLAGPVTLDPTSANRWARTFLQLSKADLKGTKTVQVGTAADAVRITYIGLTAGEAPKPTDTVKVLGRVNQGALDITKIVVKRDDDTADSDKDSDRDSDSDKS
jgi:hypothetical protein